MKKYGELGRDEKCSLARWWIGEVLLIWERRASGFDTESLTVDHSE
jgi:hypothetical protein